MSKAHRGKGIKDQVKRGRGECPRCNNKNIKVQYEHEIEGQKMVVCKFCNAFIKNNPPPKPVVEEAPAPVAEEVAVETPAETETPAEETASEQAPAEEEATE